MMRISRTRCIALTAGVVFGLIPHLLAQGIGNLGTGAIPTSLQFNYEQGFPQSGSSSSLVPQSINNPVSGPYTTTVTGGNSWLSVTPSGTGPGLITVSANAAGLATSNTPYSGSFTLSTPAGTQTVNVSLLVSSGVVVYANPGVLNIAYSTVGSNPRSRFQVFSSDSSNIPISVSSNQSWLTVAPEVSIAATVTPDSFVLTINGAALTNGVNAAVITVTSGAANTQLAVPVIVTASGTTSTGTPLVLGSSGLTFNAQANGPAPNSQALSVTASTPTAYTAGVSTQSGGTWLSISPTGNLNTGSASSLTVSVNPASLAAATYQGSISLVTASGTQTVPVALVVAPVTPGNIIANATSLLFNYQSGGVVPGAQTFTVTSSNGSTLNYTVGAVTQSGGGWLVASSPSGATSGSPGQPVNVSLNGSVVAGLATGTYSGTVTVTPTSGGAASVTVTLVVSGLPTVSASPALLSLNYQAGSSNTPTATIQVSGSAASVSYISNASSSGWLHVSPTSGTVGAGGTTLQVTVSPGGLAAGTYSGTIAVAGTNGAVGSSITTVTLVVSAPLPTIAAVVNAATGSGGPVAPGEIVSIFGPSSNPIGPSTPATLTLDSNGNVATTLGGVQVVFNGTPAPLTYVSSTQINAVVPYGIVGMVAPYAQVKYLNQSSNAFTLTTVSTAPGIFTQTGTGTGSGAILNQDNSTNGPNNPAAKGSVVVIYMTGEGSTTPAGITGKVTCSTCTIAQLPVPVLPVTVTLIDSNNTRYPANFIYAGEAPGFVSGVLQVDAIIPTTVPSGNLQIVVGVGPNASQAGVTVSVR
jgi:uncharacterized protein (TIGR03437 family)